MIYSFLLTILVKSQFLLIKWVLLILDLDKINLDDDNNFDEDDPDIIIHVRLLARRNKFEKPKALKEKISKELMSVVWHPT